MRIPILLVALSFLALLPPEASAQGAQEALIRYAKADRPGTVAEYPYPKDVVNDAMHLHFERLGLGGGKEEKGFVTYMGINWTEISPDKLEVYYKVDGRGNKSTVMLLVSKGYDNYVTTASDAAMEARIKAFLDGLLPDIQAIQLRQSIAAQEDAVRRAEKAVKSSEDDGNKLAREKEKLEKQIAENNAEKQKTADALSAERGKLDALKSQVK